MISMLDRLVSIQSNRLVLLAYGVNHSGDHVFKDQLKTLVEQNENILLLTCYSEPRASDKIGEDFHVQGFVSVDLLRTILTDPDCDYYLCGPPPFMQSLFNGLTAWGVDESRLHSEAFGPASITHRKEPKQHSDRPATNATVNFVNTDVVANWNGKADSLLELADALGVEIDSGCRSGSCGTCSTELIAGKIEYPNGKQPDCQPGHCLVCIAKPDGPIELGA